MSYSDFKNIEQAVSTLDLTVEDVPHLFSTLAPVQPSERLKQTLDETLDLAASISTEKARSELIITPILLEVRRIFNYQLGYFSGNTFNVDDSKGLTGACDFILSATANQSLITAPVLTIVEVKDNDIRVGLGQCVAQMVAVFFPNWDAPSLRAFIFLDITLFYHSREKIIEANRIRSYTNKVRLRGLI